RHGLREIRDDAEYDGAEQRRQSYQWMKQKADHQVDRQPWQVEQRSRSRARQEGPDAVEVAQRLQSVVAVSDFQRQTDDRLIHPRAERLVEPAADAREDAATDHVEQAE